MVDGDVVLHGESIDQILVEKFLSLAKAECRETAESVDDVRHTPPTKISVFLALTFVLGAVVAAVGLFLKAGDAPQVERGDSRLNNAEPTIIDAGDHPIAPYNVASPDQGSSK